LVGGWSAERQVSLEKGKHVESALREAGYSVDVIDVSKDIAALIARLSPKPDVVFNNLYGQGGEDGTIQSVLEMLEIPYTHSSVKASAVGMDKPLCKYIAQSLGVQTPKSIVVPLKDVSTQTEVPYPFVVKPTAEGSSVGVCLIHDKKTLDALDFENWAFGEDVLVEAYIPGKELTVAVLDGRAQAVTEIVSQTSFFDYEAKYHDTRTELVLPAKISDEIYKMSLDYAERVYNEIGCAGLARCDFRYDETVDNLDDGITGLYFLEINTQPGLTAESIGPSQVIYNGMSFVELCSLLVETAKCHAPKQKTNKAKKAASNDPSLLSGRG